MDFDIFNPSRHLRRAVLFWLSMLLSGAAFIVFYLTASAQNYTLFPLIEIVFGLFSAYICYQTFRDNISERLTKAYVWLFMLTVCSGVLIHPLSYGVYIWANLFPVMAYLVLGKRSAALVSSFGLVFVFCSLLMQVNQHPQHAQAHLLVNLLLSYVSIWAAAHILEVKRTVSETSLGNLASRDALTGVYNRHALMHHFARYKQESQQLPLSLLILDLDYFKQVNDRHGHDVGDRVLAQFAALLDSLCNEHLVYRIGGEEFCIAFHNTTLSQATIKAEQIRLTIQNYTFSVEDIAIKLTVSIGVYQCHHFNSLRSMLQKADIELYRAKKSGRNQVMTSPENDAINESVENASHALCANYSSSNTTL